MYVYIVAVLYKKLVQICVGNKAKALLISLLIENVKKLSDIVKEYNFEFPISTSIFQELYKINYEHFITFVAN